MQSDFELSSIAELQFSANGQLKHFLNIEGLSKKQILSILSTANSFISDDGRKIKKLPLLRGKTVINLFFEDSTRTRTTFELAAKKLSADVINLNIATSSTSKGESLLDTVQNLKAMGTDIFVIRHGKEKAPHYIAKHIGSDVAIINAGDGKHAHPTQALLDMLTIWRHKGDISSLKVAIIGDVRHSRVARSEIAALQTLEVNELRVIAPCALLPEVDDSTGIKVFHNIEQGLTGVDVVIMLRIQKERMNKEEIPAEHSFFSQYGLTKERLALAKADAIVMHPGPINRQVEISSEVADGPQSLILKQVFYGIALRMAIMSELEYQQN